MTEINLFQQSTGQSFVHVRHRLTGHAASSVRVVMNENIKKKRKRKKGRKERKKEQSLYKTLLVRKRSDLNRPREQI